MNRLILLYMLLLSCCVFAQNDSIKLRPKQQIEYRHNISAQVNPAGSYLSLMISNMTTKTNFVEWNAALRYTYTLHPNILLGVEAAYNSYNHFPNDSKNQNERDHGYWVHYYGPMARFIYNGLKWCRPFADIELGYRRLYWFCDDNIISNTDTFKPTQMYIGNTFQWYAAAGMSFRFWQNHFNIDVMFRASNWYFINGKWDVTWKIGYNFNSKK